MEIIQCNVMQLHYLLPENQLDKTMKLLNQTKLNSVNKTQYSK